MIRVARAAALAGALFWAPAAMARTADYAQSEAQFHADAAALKVADLPAMPQTGDVHVVVENASRLDNELRILGVGCKAWEVINPLSKMVERALQAWDADSTLTVTDRRPLIRLRIDSSLATMRCVEVEELVARCLTRTAIAGRATIEQAGRAPRVEPLAIEIEQVQAGSSCPVARGTGLAGWSASIALVDRLRKLAAQ